MRVKFTAGDEDTLRGERRLMKKIEYAQMKRQIQNFASFLPDEVLTIRKEELDTVKNYVGIVLCAQIYGLTVLTDKYNKFGLGGMYKLTATLNAYVGAIIEALHYYGGDIMKFCGESILTQWKVMPHNSLVEILHEVVCCALFMQTYLGNFETENNVNLMLKIAISCGNMSFFVMGVTQRKYYALIGESVNDIKLALEKGEPGDVVMSVGTWAHMLQERYEVAECESVVKIWKVVYKANEANKRIHHEEKQIDLLKLIDKHLGHRKTMHARKKFESYHTDAMLRNIFIRNLPERRQVKTSPKIWMIDQMRIFMIKPVRDQIEESQPVEYLTQILDATVQLISIEPTNYYEPLLIEMLATCFRHVCKISGNIGTVVNMRTFTRTVNILVIFGLKGQTYGSGYQDALITGYKLRCILKGVPGVGELSVSVTNGIIYSGVVGHPFRRDYVLIGMSLVRAMKMNIQFPNKVTCDFRTFKHCKLSSFYFKIIAFAKHKSDDMLGSVFEYNEEFETAKFPYFNTKLPIVGRFAEYNGIRTVVYDSILYNLYAMCIFGPRKIGKSAILQRSYAAIASTNLQSLVNIELEGSSAIPYFCVSKIYRILFDKKGLQQSIDHEQLYDLPRELVDWDEEAMRRNEEDVIYAKHKILDNFRNMVRFTKEFATVIIIDNFEEIDSQSWEILEVCLEDKSIRLITAAIFEPNSTLKAKMLQNSLIKMHQLPPVSDRCIPALACQFLAVAGIPKKLVYLLVKTCHGRPGYLQSCLLRLVNNNYIQLQLINRNSEDSKHYFYPHSKFTGYLSNQVIPVVAHSDQVNFNLALTMTKISLDLFDSFTPYEQLVIKTGAVLGNLFTRMLLMVALKYPTEIALSKVILHLFDEDVFDCGCRYLYADNGENTGRCCSCNFEDEYFNPVYERFLPKYAYCKILHFKNKSLREVAYEALAGNQRKELHLLCTDVLENINNRCPTCLRQPITYVFNIGKFKDIMKYCNKVELLATMIEQKQQSNDIKDAIRALIQASQDDTSPHKKPYKSKRIVRPIYDAKLCNCYEILLRVYSDLIYHSECGGHLAKQIYFTMQYGLLLIAIHDYTNAVAYLTKARELCLVDAKMVEDSITDTFRKLNIGKIEIGLAKASLELRQLRTAKNHLTIAIRQYNIPTLALSYKCFRWMLVRRFLSNKLDKRILPYSDVLVRGDMGNCLSLCSRLFYFEGHWKMARLAANYSIYLIRSINNNVQMLLEVFCNAIDVHRYLCDNHTCEKLIQSIAKDVMQNYCFNYLYNGYYIMTLLCALFRVQVAKGDLMKAIRLGYRVIDLNQILFSRISDLDVASMLIILLLSNFRIREAVSICNLLLRHKSEVGRNRQYYYGAVLFMKLYTNFQLEPTTNILKYAAKFKKEKSSKPNWEDYYFMSLVRLYYKRIQNDAEADEWKFMMTFNKNNVKREIVLLTLITSLEYRLHNYMKLIKSGEPTNLMNLEENYILDYMKLLKDHLFVSYKHLVPRYLCLQSWYLMLKRKEKKAYKTLKKAENIAKAQGNEMIRCMAKQMMSIWNGTITARRNKTSKEYFFQKADNTTLDEWCRMLYTFPIR